jgi:hypothetical protein
MEMPEDQRTRRKLLMLLATDSDLVTRMFDDSDAKVSAIQSLALEAVILGCDLVEAFERLDALERAIG